MKVYRDVTFADDRRETDQGRAPAPALVAKGIRSAKQNIPKARAALDSEWK